MNREAYKAVSVELPELQQQCSTELCCCFAGMDSSQRSNSWTSCMWKAVQKYAAALVAQQDTDDVLPLTNQQAHQLETQRSREVLYRQEMLNDMGESKVLQTSNKNGRHQRQCLHPL